jgi:hypothetical protein
MGKEGPKIATVSSKELGSRCWSTARFIQGVRCPRVMDCDYPEKKKCVAVDAEIAYLHEERRKFEAGIHAKISKLVADKTM